MNNTKQYNTLAIVSRDANKYSALFDGTKYPQLKLICCTSDVNEFSENGADILLSEPNLAAVLLKNNKHFGWIQSTWAGNSHIINTGRSDFLLTGVKDIFGAKMREYVFAYLLYFVREIASFSAAQSKQQWQQFPTSFLMNQTIGIIGLGNIGQSIAKAADAFGMKVVGIASKRRENVDYDIYLPHEKHLFAKHCDYVVNLLPDTPQTTHFIDAMFISHLPRGCVLINAGRGSAIVESALVDALNSGHLFAAVLDVFEQEPLPPAHPFWTVKNLHITSHTAARSEAQDVLHIFDKNIKRLLTNEPLHYMIDLKKGY